MHEGFMHEGYSEKVSRDCVGVTGIRFRAIGSPRNRMPVMAAVVHWPFASFVEFSHSLDPSAAVSIAGAAPAIGAPDFVSPGVDQLR